MFPQTMCLRVYKVTLVWLFFFGKEAAATKKNSWVAAGRSDPHIPRQQPCLAFTVWQQALCLWDQLMFFLPQKSISPSLNNNCHNLILIASSIYTFQALGPIFPGPDCLGNDWTPFTTFLNKWRVWAVYLLKYPQRNTSLFWLYPFIHPQTEWLFGLELEGGKAWNGEQLVLQ